jgi:hypothetical protein
MLEQDLTSLNVDISESILKTAFKRSILHLNTFIKERDESDVNTDSEYDVKTPPHKRKRKPNGNGTEGEPVYCICRQVKVNI